MKEMTTITKKIRLNSDLNNTKNKPDSKLR